jgi:hypothetical protein
MKIHKCFEADNSEQDLRMAILKLYDDRIFVEAVVRIEDKNRYLLKLFDNLEEAELYFNKIIRV